VHTAGSCCLFQTHARWLHPLTLDRRAGQRMMTLSLLMREEEMAPRVMIWTGGTWMSQSSQLQQQPSLQEQQQQLQPQQSHMPRP
jgi:hypothetical protein